MSQPRPQVNMFMIRMCTNLNLPRIGKACGGEDHSTVKYVFEQIDCKLTTTLPSPARCSRCETYCSSISSKRR